MNRLFTLALVIVALASAPTFAGGKKYDGEGGKTFEEVHGIPKGFKNAGVRTPSQQVCEGTLTLDLDNCGVDQNGRKWCANKCVLAGE